MLPRQFARVLLDRLFLWLALLQLAAPAVAQTAAEYHARADQALQSLLLKFWDGPNQYLRRSYPADGALSSYWIYANAWQAVMDGVERTQGQAYAGLVESLYLGQDQRGWYSDYYDDECWMAEALIRAFDLTGNPKYLGKAELLFADVITGWDDGCCGTVKGGVWWDKAHTQKATASNAGTALTGALLFARTGKQAYLVFAQQVYSFWYTNMVNSTTHQVCDHIDSKGVKVWWRFTYNEGLMIGASVALCDATGDTSFLTKAHLMAGYMIANEVISTVWGPVLHDGDNSGCQGDCHQFKGPAYRHLLQLYSRDPSRTGYLRVLQASANALWNLARDGSASVFSVNWAGPAQTNADLAQDNAACMALSLYAQRSGPYPGSGLSANQYEAENATLRKVGMEALHAPFTGWGCVAGWNRDGQAVDFQVSCPEAGQYTLEFRYAAGAGAATRELMINGDVVSPNLAFPGTGAWGTYRTNEVVCALPVGASTVTMAFSQALGSANYLNLDNLTLVVDLPLAITSVAVSSGGVTLGWTAKAGLTYQVQCRDSLLVAWSDLGTPVISSGERANFTDNSPVAAQRFYRVLRR